MPWSPTRSFPHPLAVIHPENCKETVANFYSYTAVDALIWEGLGDLINKFRRKTLVLDPLDRITGPNLLNQLHLPYAYLWYGNFPHHHCAPSTHIPQLLSVLV